MHFSFIIMYLNLLFFSSHITTAWIRITSCNLSPRHEELNYCNRLVISCQDVCTIRLMSGWFLSSFSILLRLCSPTVALEHRVNLLLLRIKSYFNPPYYCPSLALLQSPFASPFIFHPAPLSDWARAAPDWLDSSLSFFLLLLILGSESRVRVLFHKSLNLSFVDAVELLCSSSFIEAVILRFIQNKHKLDTSSLWDNMRYNKKRNRGWRRGKCLCKACLLNMWLYLDITSSTTQTQQQ